MTITTSAVAIGSDSAILNFAGRTGTTMDVQFSARADFSFCPSPIYNVAAADHVNFESLNQRATYFVRARNRAADGITVDDWGNTFAFHTHDRDPQATAPAAIMVQPAIIVVPEKILSITPVGGDPSYPASNLLIDGPVAFQCPIAASYFYFGVQTAGAPIDTVALLNTNAPEGSIFYVSVGDTAAEALAQTTLVYAGTFRASANLPGRKGYHGLVQFPASTKPFWLLQVLIPSDGSARFTAGTFYAEHLVMGRNRATKSFSADKSETPAPRSTIDRTRSGLPDRISGLAMRKVSFDISYVREADYETLLRDLIYHENEPVLIVPNSKAGGFLHDRILYGDLTGGQVTQPSSGRFTRTFGINSLI